MPHQANGSLIVRGEKAIGSTLIGQDFKQPHYFHPARLPPAKRGTTNRFGDRISVRSTNG